MFRRSILFVFMTAAWLACTPQKTVPQQPQIEPDTTTLLFNGGTIIGTSITNTVQLANGGSADLIISSITLSGDSAFVKQNPQLLDVPYAQTTFVEVFFTPTQPIAYTGQLDIRSNAENTPDQVILLQGLGIEPDAGS